MQTRTGRRVARSTLHVALSTFLSPDSTARDGVPENRRAVRVCVAAARAASGGGGYHEDIDNEAGPAARDGGRPAVGGRGAARSRRRWHVRVFGRHYRRLLPAVV